MDSYQEYDHMFKLVLVGDMGVGKSCIFLRFTQGAFVQKHVGTVGVQFGNKIIKTGASDGDKTVKLLLWDTAGSERYKSMAKNYYKGAVGVMMVYDITDENSLFGLNEWHTMVNNVLDPKQIVVFVLGNKADLESQRQVSKDKAIEFCRTHKYQHREVSAKSGNGIETAFEEMAKKICRSIVKDNLDSIRGTVVQPIKEPLKLKSESKEGKKDKQKDKKDKKQGCQC